MAYGIDRDVFDRVMLEYKQQWDVELKINFTPDQMKIIAYSYKMVLNDYGIEIEMDPFQQLKQAIRSVLDSWFSESAVYYRDHLQIAEDWGTAVVVQKWCWETVRTAPARESFLPAAPLTAVPGLTSMAILPL